jgi:alpha-mannosidase
VKFFLDLIAARLPLILAAARREVCPLPATIAPADDPGNEQPLAVGDAWGEPYRTYLIRVPLRVPESWDGGQATVHIQLSDYEDLSGPEALAYLNGEPLQGIDHFHREIVLGERARPGRDQELVLEAYNSRKPGPHILRALELVLVDEVTAGLYHDLRVLLGALRTMPDGSVTREQLGRVLEHAYRTLDLRRPGSDEFRRSAGEAREVLRAAYGKQGGQGDPRTVAVGHAHIDLAWLWPVSQTRRKGARTFSTVLRLMERYPDFRFVASQPALYEMVREDEPALYQQIRARIREGRWEPTGATWVEMDCNLTGGEALVRQFLFGQRYFRQQLGVESRLLWLPDVFGYSAALPQIMLGCGVDAFMTTKISWNEYNRIPHDTFRWRGIDGSEVLTHMVTSSDAQQAKAGGMYTYNGHFTPEEVAGNWRMYQDKGINDELLYLFGYGDGGGGPTADMLEAAERLDDLPGFMAVEQSSAGGYIRRLRERVWDNPDLPSWVGELYLEYHRGTYTSQAWIKRANRTAELLYREAELWSSLACLLDPETMDRRRDELSAGWRQILFNQFHDILPGSSVHQVYEDARVDFAWIIALGTQVRDAALADLAGAIRREVDSLLVFNPAPFYRDDLVEVEAADRPDVADTDGTPLDIQHVVGLDGVRRYLVPIHLPALGYECYPIGPWIEEEHKEELLISRETLENRFFRLTLDGNANIISLIDKRVGREVIRPGTLANRLIAFEDRPLHFDAWDIQIDYQDKPYPVDDVAEWRVVEEGPLRGGVEIVRRYEQSTIRQRILLHRDVPRIDFPTHVDWHERQTLLKVAFPVAVNSTRATFDIQWGNVERPTHWNTSWDWARFETCAHKWIDLSEGDYGVSLLNDCKYGHDVKDGTMRLTLIKSAISPDREADQGEHIFTYALLPHPGDWRQGETVKHAYLFNMPARAFLAPALPAGPLPDMDSLVQTERPGLVIETVKPAEDGNGLIVRVYDAHNTRGPATLRFQRAIASAEETNMLEERVGDVGYAEQELQFVVRPYGISTFRVRLAGDLESRSAPAS